jgi:transposase
VAFDKAVTASFLHFLEYLLELYQEGEIVLVVGNASYHTSKAVQSGLKQHPRLRLLYLPPHSLHLNPVERIWVALKASVSANRSFAHPSVVEQIPSQAVSSA